MSWPGGWDGSDGWLRGWWGADTVVETPISWATVEDAIHNWMTVGSGLNADKIVWAQQAGARPTGAWLSLRLMGIRIIGQDWVDVTQNVLAVSLPVGAIGSSQFTVSLHGLVTGDGPIRLIGGSLPTGLAVDTNYWIIVVNSSTIALATTFLNAMSGTAISFSGGALPITLASTSETERVGQELVYQVRGVREVTFSIQCFGSPSGVNGAVSKLHRIMTYLPFPSVHDRLVQAGVGVARFGNISSFDGLIGQGLFEPRATMDVTCFLAAEVADFGNYIATVQGKNLTTDETFTISR